jgi:hypothetical protein
MLYIDMHNRRCKINMSLVTGSWLSVHIYICDGRQAGSQLLEDVFEGLCDSTQHIIQGLNTYDLQVKLAQHTYSNLFGTFLCNSTQERTTLKVAERTFSVWKFLKAPNFRNHLYCTSRDPVSHTGRASFNCTVKSAFNVSRPSVGFQL